MFMLFRLQFYLVIKEGGYKISNKYVLLALFSHIVGVSSKLFKGIIYFHTIVSLYSFFVVHLLVGDL